VNRHSCNQLEGFLKDLKDFFKLGEAFCLQFGQLASRLCIFPRNLTQITFVVPDVVHACIEEEEKKTICARTPNSPLGVPFGEIF